ncbi:MAG: hypothetical protein J2P57_10780 [Acidimicrobiaceae bacterium]|nr:hypothetical protein [Acidimicrobiaceae bacterium]
MIKGTLLTESLRIGASLAVAGLLVTRLERRHVSGTASQPDVWTFLEFEAHDDVAGPLAAALEVSLQVEDGWYADFASDAEHVVVFANHTFRYRRDDPAGRRAAEAYGRSVGVPDDQLDWPD